MTNNPGVSALLAAILVGAGVAAVAPPLPDAPVVAADQVPEEAEERAILARRAVKENCLICHGEELIASQRLTDKQWAAEVEKMVGWGAPLPPESRPLVIEHLSAAYPVDGPAYVPTFMTVAAARGSVGAEAESHEGPEGQAERGAPLYAANCANCHGPDGQGAELGNNLVEKPVLYRAIEFRSVVREGQNRMPGFAATLDARAEADVLAWLRERRYQPPSAP